MIARCTRQQSFAQPQSFGTWLSGVVFLVSLMQHSIAVAEVLSVQEFNAFEPKWPKLMSVTWNIEGRYGIISDQTMTLKNCKLHFVLQDGVSRPGSNVSVVEVQGSLERDLDQRVFFKVNSLKPRRTDSETLQFKRGAITTTNANEWYAVAEWGKNRAEFYNDDILMKEVQELYLNGILVEKRLLGRDDFQGLLALAKKAQDFQLGNDLNQQMQHEALRIQSNLIGQKKFDSATLLQTLSKHFPGATTPFEKLPMEVAEQYRTDPITTYNTANETQQQVLHRIFYLDEMVRHIVQDAKLDGSNGIAIAKRLKAEVPERADLAIKYHNKELDYRLSRVNVMTRNDVVELADIFEAEGKPEKAIQLKQSWLKVREPILAEDGARGYVELGQEWESLLNDEQTATTYYLKAVQKDSQYELATLWLREHGFIEVNRKWMLEADAPPTNEVAMSLAIRDGRVTTGMTTKQALAAMAAKPDSVIRFASNGTTTELWVYESSHTTIRFARVPLGESKVVAIDKVSQ